MTTFNIIKEYLKKIEFTSPHAPSIFFDNEECPAVLSVNLDIKCARASEENIFDVTIVVSLGPTYKTSEAFHLNMEYSCIVTVTLPDNADEDEKRRVLMVEVPRTIFPVMRDIITQITFRAGFPPVCLQYFDFEQNYLSKYNNNDDTTHNNHEVSAPESDSVMQKSISYETVAAEFSSTNDGADFVKTCISHGMKPDLDFESTPMFKYLMRFIEVPKFNTPAISEAKLDVSFYETLYRMLVLDDKFKYRFVAGEALELHVTYGEFNDKPISQMDVGELHSLVASLIIDSWVNYNVPLSRLFSEDRQSDADDYLQDLGINTMISADEYMWMFGMHADMMEFDRSQVQDWHRKLQHIDISTIQYRY